MNAEYPLSHAYFERAILTGPVLKQPMTALISKWKVSDTDDERRVYTGIQTVAVIWKLWVSSLFLCKFLSYIRPPVASRNKIAFYRFRFPNWSSIQWIHAISIWCARGKSRRNKAVANYESGGEFIMGRVVFCLAPKQGLFKSNSLPSIVLLLFTGVIK